MDLSRHLSASLPPAMAALQATMAGTSEEEDTCKSEEEDTCMCHMRAGCIAGYHGGKVGKFKRKPAGRL